MIVNALEINIVDLTFLAMRLSFFTFKVLGAFFCVTNAHVDIYLGCASIWLLYALSIIRTSTYD